MPIERVLAKLRQIALPPVKFLLLMLWRFVVELPIVAGDTELLDQSKRGEQLRMIEDDLSENFLVKQIETPRPKPDQINQEDCDCDRDDRDNRAKPFQNPF